MSRCLSAREIILAAKFLELHVDKICRLNRRELAAELGQHLGRLVTVANVDTAIDAAGMADTWRAAQGQRKSATTAAVAKRNSRERNERLAKLEAAFLALCRDLGVDGECLLAGKDRAND